ncbi:MAG: PIN domain-containing protein [bacterium]
MRNYLFDSFALLCWLQEEKGAEVVNRFVLDAQELKVKLLVNIIHLGEVYYRIAKVSNLQTAHDIVERIKLLPVKIVSASDSLVMRAAEMKAQYSIAYADALALATALEYQAAIITGDPEFPSVEDKVEIMWIT